VVYSGVSPDDFPVPASPPPEAPWRWRVLFVGRLEEDKGVDTAVAALRHLPGPATLTIIGPAAAHERERVDEAVRRAGVGSRVTFAELPRSALAERYRESDVLVFPSRWEEPFGLVPVEAMACATPVVATRTGGSAEFLADGVNCLAFPREDAEGLAGAVNRLAGDPALRARLVANGLDTARALTVDRLADSFEQWLVGAAGRFRAGRPAPRRLPGFPAGATG
jgi:glycosyltransferase involved in cell wall biosynthesis